MSKTKELKSKGAGRDRRNFAFALLGSGGLLLLLSVLALGIGSTSFGLGDALRVLLWKTPFLRSVLDEAPSATMQAIITHTF